MCGPYVTAISELLVDTVQVNAGQLTVVDAGGHIGAERLPAAIRRRTRIEQAQPGAGDGVPGDVAVPENQDLAIGVLPRHPRLAAGRGTGLVDDGEPHTR